MTLNEIPAWNEIESQPWFASLTPEEKKQSLTKWQGTMMQFASDPKEKFAVAATAKAKARSFFGEEMPDDPIADALQRRQKDLEDIGSRYDAFSKGQLEEDDEEVLTLNDTLKGNTPYSVIKGRLFVSPSLVWDKAAYEKVVNEAPVDEDERVLAMSAYEGSKERAAEGVVNSLGYTDEAFRDFAAKGFKEGKSNAAILDEWKANNKLPEGILGSLRGVGRQAYFGLRSGLSGLERAMGGLGGFFGSESAQKYAEESGKEAQSYMQRTLGEGPEFIGELTAGATSIIPTLAAGAAASIISEGAALPAAASVAAGALQSAGATQAETYEFYREQGLDHANALAESRVDGLVSGLITGAITHYAGKLGDKIGLGKGIEGLFSGPASKIASKLTQREISESLKAGAKAVGGSFLQEGSEELLDQAAQDAYSMIKRDPTLTLAEAINNALQAGKVGAVLGGAAEAGKIGLNSLLNSAKFSVAETPLEKELQNFFEIKQTAADAVVGNPNVQSYVNALGTAKSVVDENLAANNRLTAKVLDEQISKGAEDLKDNIKTDVAKVAANIAPIVNEAPPPAVDENVPPVVDENAPLAVDETPLVSPEPPVSPAGENAPIGEIPPEPQPPQGQPPETPTDALPISPATPRLPSKERPEMGLQQVGEGNAQPEEVAETRSEEKVAPVATPSLKPPRVGNVGAIPTVEESARWAAADAFNAAYINNLSDEELEAFGTKVGVRRQGVSLEQYRQKILANTHPDDLLDAIPEPPSPPKETVPTEPLPAGRKVTPGGVASPAVEQKTKDRRDSIPAEDLADYDEFMSLLERRGPAQNRVKGFSFTKTDEKRFQELGKKLRKYLFETVSPETDPVIWKDVSGNDIYLSAAGTLYTFENGRVRTGPAYESENFIGNFNPKPIPADFVEKSNAVDLLPEGYVKQGELYVYEKTQPLPKDDAAGQRGAVAPAPTAGPAPEAQPPVTKTRKEAKTKKDAPKTVAEAEAKIAEQSAVADFLTGTKEEAAQEALRAKKGTFIRENATSVAEVNFLRDLLSGGWDKSLDDVASGRVAGARAEALAKAAESAKLIDAFTASRFSQTAEKQPVSPQVQAFRDAVAQMTPTAQAKWTPELRATAEAYLDSGGTTGLDGLTAIQKAVVQRLLPRTPEQEAADAAEEARNRKMAAEDARFERSTTFKSSSLPPIPSKKTRKLGAKGMEVADAALDELAKVIPNIRELVEVRNAQEGDPNDEGFYDPQTDKTVVLANNVFLKDHHAGSEAMAMRETIVHELLHRGFAKLRSTNPQLFQQFEAFSVTDTNDNLLDALVRRGYTMYSNWRNDPVQAQKAREEVFVRKAALDLAVNGLDAIKSPTSLASQFFKWFKEFLSKLLGRVPPQNQLVHWAQVFLNAAQAEMGGTQGERMLSMSQGRDLLSPEKYARHAELEAKHNAGTITPEETAEAQVLVDEAAKAAGFNVSGVGNGITYEAGDEPDSVYGERDNVMSHGGTFGFYFSDNPAVWNDYAKPRRRGEKGRINKTFLSIKKAFSFPEELISYDAFQKLLRDGGVVLPAEVKSRLDRLVAGGFGNTQPVWKWLHPTHVGAGASYGESLKKAFTDAGYDGIIHPDSSLMEGGLGTPATSYVVFNPSQIKSADPFTGVPLEQRFQPESPDIRYALGEPDQSEMEVIREKLNTFIDENKATNSFLEAFGPVRVERMQQRGEKIGPAYIQAQVRPLMQRAQAELGFEMDEEGNYVLSQRATDKAHSVLAQWLQDGRKFAKAYNKKAEKFYEKLFPGMEEIPVDSDMAAAVLLHEIMSYAKALAAASPKAEDQILLDMVRPQYGSVVLANYDLTMHKTGRTLQTARNYSEGPELGQDAVERSNQEGEEKAKQELGPEAISIPTEEGKVGLEAGVDAAPDLPAVDPTLRLLDLAVESLDDVAKADAEAVFDLLLDIAQLEELVAEDEKRGDKAMSILRNPNLAARNYPTDPAERKALLAQKKSEVAEKLAKLRNSLEGAKPETKKKVKTKAAKTKSKTDSVQKLIDKLAKMPDEAKEAKPKAETLRSVLSDAIKAKDFDEKAIRDAADKAGATPEQADRLVEEAKRLHEIAQDKTPSKTKLRKFLLSHPQETLYNPEQRQALVKTFLRTEIKMSEPEIARYLPKFESNFVKAMEDAREKYLDGLETRFNAPKKARESRVDAQNRKLLQALRAGLAETKSPKVALLEKLGFKEFKPTDKHVIAKLDSARTEALANGEFAKARLKQTELSSLLLRRRPPMGWMQLLNQAWITSALSSFRNLALNVWTPLGEAVSRYFGALASALKTGDFTAVTALTKALGEAFRRVPARFKFAYSANTFTQQANAAIAEQASLIDEFRRSLSQLRDKKLSKKDRTKAATRVIFSFGDYSRRLLQSIDESWFSLLESFVSSANLLSDVNKYGIKAEALTEASVHFATQAKNDAYAASQIVDRLSDYLDGLKGKTTAEIQQALELYRMDQLGISPENLAFTNEMLDVIEQLRLRSGVEGDALLKAAKRNINDYRRLAWVRAAEKADADTREWVSALLTGKGVEKVDVDQVLKDATEGSERAASYGMGLHRVEEAPALDIGNTFAKMIEAMGQQAIRVNPMLGRMMVGFFGIPVNLMNKSLWFAPGYGLLRYYVFRKMAERHPDKQFYAYSLANEKERAQRFREVMFGHAVFGLLAALEAFDDRDEEETEGLYVTLGGPANKTEKDAWLARGFRPYSICIKHEDGSVTSIPYGVGAGEFMKMPLMAAGAFDDMRLNKKLGNREDMSSALEYFNAFAAGVGRQATFLGAKNTVGALLPDTFGAGTVANLAFAAGNFFPFNGLDRSLETLMSGPPDRSRTGAILANIPYLRHFEALGARPATNVFGDPWGSKAADPIEIIEDRLLSQSISVWNTSKPLTGQDKKLYEFIGRYQIGPNGPQRGALELRNGYLTDQEWANYRDVWAANAKREWLSSLDRMARMDEDGRAKAAAELSTKASRKAKSRFNYE